MLESIQTAFLLHLLNLAERRILEALSKIHRSPPLSISSFVVFVVKYQHPAGSGADFSNKEHKGLAREYTFLRWLLVFTLPAGSCGDFLNPLNRALAQTDTVKRMDVIHARNLPARAIAFHRLTQIK